MPTIDELINAVEQARTECQKLQFNADEYTTFERGEQYQKARSLSEEASELLLEAGINAVEQAEFEHPFDDAEDFFCNDGWMIDEFKEVEGITKVDRIGEARFGAVSAVSELEYVETSPRTDSRPYGIAAVCAKETLDSALKNLQDLQ